MLPTASTTAGELFYAVASTSINLFNSSVDWWIALAGTSFAFLSAIGIFIAVVLAVRRALKR